MLLSSQQNRALVGCPQQGKVRFNQAFLRLCFVRPKEARKPYYQDDLTTAFRLFNQGDGWWRFWLLISMEIMLSFLAQLLCLPDSLWRLIILNAFRSFSLGSLREKKHKERRFKRSQTTSLPMLWWGSARLFYCSWKWRALYQSLYEWWERSDDAGFPREKYDFTIGSLVDGLAMGKSLLQYVSYAAAFSVAAAMGELSVRQRPFPTVSTWPKRV